MKQMTFKEKSVVEFQNHIHDHGRRKHLLHICVEAGPARTLATPSF